MKGLGLILILLAAFFNGHAQWQIGVAGGIAQYRGDLIDRFYTHQMSKPAFGLHVKYEVTPRLLLRAAFNAGKLVGADSLMKKESLRFRNLSFQSKITEFSAVAELHAFRLDEKRWSPYLFGGIAVFHYDPYTFDTTGRKIFLQPLGTEGQGIPGYPERSLYSRTQLALPFGGGIRFDVSDRITLGAELGFRKLFTDYLDDVSTNYADAQDLLLARGPDAVSVAYRADEVPGGFTNYPEKGSQRGGASVNDIYYMAQLQLTYRFGAGGFFKGGNGGGSRKGRYGCPPNPM